MKLAIASLLATLYYMAASAAALTVTTRTFRTRVVRSRSSSSSSKLFSSSVRRPDATKAIQAAIEATKQYGATSPEAKVAWDAVEEMDASDNTYVCLCLCACARAKCSILDIILRQMLQLQAVEIWQIANSNRLVLACLGFSVNLSVLKKFSNYFISTFCATALPFKDH